MSNYLIYKLTFESERTYIGSTNNFDRRLEEHKARFLKEYNDCIVDTEILFQNLSKDRCRNLEDKLIKESYLDRSYNIQYSSYYVEKKEKSTICFEEAFVRFDPNAYIQEPNILSLEDKRKIMAECGDASVILFEYYLSKAGVEEFMYTDYKTSIALGWSIRKVEETRKKLTRAGYFFQQKGKYNAGAKIVTTYLGKEVVAKIKTELEHYEKTPKEK